MFIMTRATFAPDILNISESVIYAAYIDKFTFLVKRMIAAGRANVGWVSALFIVYLFKFFEPLVYCQNIDKPIKNIF